MSSQFIQLHTNRALLRPKPKRIFNVSPPIHGKSTWNLDTDGPINVGECGMWSLSTTDSFSVKVKMWGASGGGRGCPSKTGAGGFSRGNISILSGSTYVMVVGEGGKLVSGSGYYGFGSGGHNFWCGSPAAQGGGLSGLFSGSYAWEASIIIAGGGGTIGGALDEAGAGGGTSGQSSTSTTGGSQVSAGGNGSYKGGKLYGGGSGTSGSVSRQCGGGGYYGGGGIATGNGGGGGSGYINPYYVTDGYTEAGNFNIAGNSSDADRGNSGDGVFTTGDMPISCSGIDGRMIIS